MRKSRLLFTSCLFSLTAAFGLLSATAEAITIRGVSGASAFDNKVEPFTVYGGLSGPAPSGAGPGLYDSCANLTGLIPCNSARVHDQAILSISFKADAGAGVPTLWIVKNGTPTILRRYGSQGTVAAGAETSVSVEWAAICEVFGEGDGTGGAIAPGCIYSQTGPATATFRVGFTPSTADSTPNADQKDFKIVMGGDASGNVQTVDDCNVQGGPNPYGICGWEMNPGDEKALLRNPEPHQGRNGPIMQFDRVRVFYVPVTDINAPEFNTITAATRTFADLRIESSDSGSLSVVPGRVEGLKNETTYAFKIAMIDLAGNVGFYTANATTLVDGDFYCENPARANPANSVVPNCHLATPGEVVGVLSKQVSCFIATAAFGSPMAPQVETFRQFRNSFLLKHDLGVRFVRFYYKHSPKYAAIIAESAVLRATARAVLWPILGFVWLALQIGTPAAAALVTMAGATLYFVIRARRRRSRA
jgi:hypothetical protein